MKPDLHWNGNLKTVKIRIMAGHSLARFFFLCLSNCRPIHRKQLISVSENEIQLPQIYKHCCVEIVTLKSTCACLLSMSRADSLARPLPCFWCLSLGSRNTQCRILEKSVQNVFQRKNCWKFRWIGHFIPERKLKNHLLLVFQKWNFSTKWSWMYRYTAQFLDFTKIKLPQYHSSV